MTQVTGSYTVGADSTIAISAGTTAIAADTVAFAVSVSVTLSMIEFWLSAAVAVTATRTVTGAVGSVLNASV